jgi:ABC-2 type transport system ATP-binding protein
MDRGRILALDAPATLVRGLDAPTHVSLLHGSLSQPEARALPGAEQVTDDGVTLTIATRDPSPVLAALVERDALDGLSVRKASLEDVFLHLTGREYRA